MADHGAVWEHARDATATGPDRPVIAPEQRQLSPQEMLRVRFTRRQLLAGALFVVSAIAFLYLVLPKLLGLREAWSRLQHGDAWWLAVGAALEVLSFASYVGLFRAVFARGHSRLGWRTCYQVTMAGLAATRLFAAGGAGGIALSSWALLRSGLGPRTVGSRMVAFLVLLYGVYVAAFVIVGLGLYLGIFSGSAPLAMTIGPAILGAVAIALFLCLPLLPGDLEAFVGRWTVGAHWLGRAARWLAAAPATVGAGVSTAIALARTRDPLLLGAVGWWAFDIAVLWACFHAFGTPPPKAEIVMAYFVGMLGNTLPLPGGIGGVDGGMIGAFTAFGVNVELSVVAVLAYRAFAFWLPTVPGAFAYIQLRQTAARWRAEGVPSYT